MENEEMWRCLELQFSDYADLFGIMRLETKEEALGHKLKDGKSRNSRSSKWCSDDPTWHDEDLGMAVRSWLLIPYIAALDQSHLLAAIDRGRALIPSLREHLDMRRLTPSFLKDWGYFCEAAGALQLVYFSDRDLGRGREAIGGSKNNLLAQRVRFSHYVLRARKEFMTFERARLSVEKLINDIVDGNIVIHPDLFTVHWFERMLNIPSVDPLSVDFKPSSVKRRKRYPLTKSFRILTKKRMEVLVRDASVDVPHLDWDLPEPPAP